MPNPTDYTCARCHGFVSYEDKQFRNGDTESTRFAIDRRLAEHEIIKTKREKRFERVILCRACWEELEKRFLEFMKNA